MSRQIVSRMLIDIQNQSVGYYHHTKIKVKNYNRVFVNHKINTINHIFICRENYFQMRDLLSCHNFQMFKFVRYEFKHIYQCDFSPID